MYAGAVLCVESTVICRRSEVAGSLCQGAAAARAVSSSPSKYQPCTAADQQGELRLTNSTMLLSYAGATY